MDNTIDSKGSTENNILAKRLEKFREIIKHKGIDAAIINKRQNYLYLSGFTGTFAQLVITQSDAILITDLRYVIQASEEASLFEVIEYKDNLSDTINSVLTSKGVKILGFEEEYLTYSKYNELNSKLKVEKLQPLERAVEKLRIIKDEIEINIINKAVEIADKAFAHVLQYIKPGVSEIEVASELEYYMKKNGAKGPSFDTIVASGWRAALPHGVASEKKIQHKDVVTLDFGAIYNDYCSDMTRTVFLGTPKDEIKEIYEIVKMAQELAVKGVEKGLRGKDVDLIARDYIGNMGYRKNFGHGLGHGVGIEIHEDPKVSPLGTLVLEPGMVITIEPGIYVEKLGGVRIEDMVVVAHEGCRVLTSSTKEMILL